MKSILHKAWYYYRLIRKKPILVYQMGKVGSYSTFSSIQEHTDAVVIHSHDLSIHNTEWELAFLFRLIQQKKIRSTIINLTREPISRNLSAFFYRFEKYVPEYDKNIDYECQYLQKLFIDNYPHNLPLKWYENYMKPLIGENLLERKFSSLGFQQYHLDKIDLLVMRSELSDDMKSELVRNITELEGVSIGRKNVIRETRLLGLYKEFKSQLVLPADLVNRLCDSDYFNHFYNKEFVEETRRYWLDRL